MLAVEYKRGTPKWEVKYIEKRCESSPRVHTQATELNASHRLTIGDIQLARVRLLGRSDRSYRPVRPCDHSKSATEEPKKGCFRISHHGALCSWRWVPESGRLSYLPQHRGFQSTSQRLRGFPVLPHASPGASCVESSLQERFLGRELGRTRESSLRRPLCPSS